MAVAENAHSAVLLSAMAPVSGVCMRGAAVAQADAAHWQRGGDAVGAHVARHPDRGAPAHGAAVPGFLQGAAGAHACLLTPAGLP